MRPLTWFAGLVAVVTSVFAAAPPAKPSAEVAKLIDQLGDDDAGTRKAAQKKLQALGEDVVPVLRQAGKTHADSEVRLRANVVAADIEKSLYGEVRAYK